MCLHDEYRKALQNVFWDTLYVFETLNILMNIKKQCDQEMVHPKYLNGFKPGFCWVSDTQSKVLEVA